MALTEKLALLITLDSKSAVKGFESIGKAADKNLKNAEARIDKLGSGMKKAGAGMLAASGLAAAGLFKAGQAASELEQAVGGTEAVFGEASGAIDRFAKKAAQGMGLSEREFRSATTSIGGQLKRMTGDVDLAAERSVQLTQVAADLAATYGGTTAEAVQALGAAFRGEADPAERFNLNLKASAVNAKAVELGLAKSTSEVSEAAKAQAILALVMEQSADAQGQFLREQDTAAGAMARFRAESENLQASLGQAVAPVMADVADILGGVADRFNSLPPGVQATTSKLLALGTVGLGTAGALSFVIGKAIEMRSTFGKLGGAFRTTEGSLTKLGRAASVAGPVTAIVGLTLAASEMGKKIEDGRFEVDKLSRSLGNLADEGPAVTKMALAQQAIFGDLDGALRDLATSAPAVAQQLLDSGIAAEFGADKVELLTKELERSVTAEVAASAAQEKYNEKVQDLEGAADDASPAVRALNKMLDRSAEVLEIAETKAKNFKKAIDDALAPLDRQAAADEFNSGLLDLADRFAGADENVRGAQVNLAQAREGGDPEEIRVAQQELNEAIEETSRALAGNGRAALDNRDIFRDLTEDALGAIGAARDEGASIEDLIALRDTYAGALAEQATQLGFNTDEIATYKGTILGIPLDRTTVFDVETERAIAKVKSLRDRLLSFIPGFKLPDPTSAGRRAIGGPVSPDTPYLVGEHGRPELFVPTSAGSIDPNPRAGGSTVNQSVVINNPAPEPASRSARALRRVAVEMAA